MSQTKAQLIQPIGVVTAGGVVVTGVLTASSFTGDVVGTATSIISGGNLNLGIVTAVGTGVTGSGFSGDFTGTATGIHTGADIKVGQFTASSFVGDFTGTATSMFRGTGFKAGAVNATGFNVSGTSNGNVTGNVTGNIVGDVDGNVTGNITGNVTGVSTGNVTGNVTGNLTGNITGVAGSVASGANIHIGVITATSYSGDGQYLTGIAATNYNTQVVPGSTFSINVTASGSSAYTLSGTDRNGSVSGSNASVSVEVGDTLNFVVSASGHPFYIRVSDGGANVSTPAATNQGSQSGTVSWTPNTAGTYYYQCGNHSGMIGTITVTATTTIDLSAGNMITFNQSADTTISFANTSTAMDVTIIRVKDSNATPRTITWPDSILWDGGSAPTLISDATREGDSQQFQFITRDAGLNWYAWEPFKIDKQNGLLFTNGKNEYGALGQNAPDSSHKSSPTQVGTNINWSKIVTGGQGQYNGMALKDDGTLWGWGRNNYGQLGQNSVGGGGGPSNHGFSSPVQIPGTWAGGQFAGATGVTMTKTDGTLWQWGGGVSANNNNVNYSSPIQIGTDTDWSNNDGAVGGANNNRLIIKTDGTIWTWGFNEYGELGLNEAGPSGPGTWRSSPTQIGTDATWASTAASGMHNTGAIKTDGTLWTWGRNNNGQLGHNNKTEYSSPRQVGTDTTWSRVVSSAYNCMMAVKTDNTLWMWGTNSNGMLGQNSHTAYSSPRQIPGSWAAGNNKFDNAVYRTIAIKTDGTLWTWGSNDYGKLGQNQAQPVRNALSSPTQVGTSTNWDTISANMDFWCGVELSN